MKVAIDRAARDGLALVELDDPAKYNALTSGMVRELTDTFVALRTDRSVRVVVLTGRGKGFCAGALAFDLHRDTIDERGAIATFGTAQA